MIEPLGTKGRLPNLAIEQPGSAGRSSPDRYLAAMSYDDTIDAIAYDYERWICFAFDHPVTEDMRIALEK